MQSKEPSKDGPFYVKESSADLLSQYSKCKVAYYCGKDCQTEPCEKVHKDKCKHLRVDRRMKVGVHRQQKESCPACKEETNLGDLAWKKGVPYVWWI